MSKVLDVGDRTALLKHYEISVAEGHARDGTAIRFVGTTNGDGERVITATLGAHSAQRICPITDFLAEGLIAELGDSHLNAKPQLSRAIAHLAEKLARMHVESELAGFTITATIEGDHYEVLPKTASIDGSSGTKIPHRLSPHAHDRS